jgi:hypothetical protein
MLTDTEVRAAKAVSKSIKLFDEKGLYLLVTPGGERLWRLRSREVESLESARRSLRTL